jgi:hypothetical protein
VIHLVVWLAICLIISAIGLTRPSVPLTCSLALLAFIPESAAQLFTGVPMQGASGMLAVHPATWLLLMAFPLQLGAAPHRFTALNLRRGGTALFCFVVFVALATMSTVLGRGTSGFSQLLESLVGPAFLFLLIQIVAQRTPDRWRSIRNALQLYALFVALLAIAEYFAHRDLVFARYSAQQVGQQAVSHGAYRAMAFLGHPLICAMFLVAMLPLMRRPGFRNRTPGLVGTLVLIAGIAATGSRSGVVIAVGYLLFGNLVVRAGSGIGRVVRDFVATPVGLVVILFATPIGGTVLARLTTDRKSTAIRQNAATLFLHNWTHFIAYGKGIGASFAVSAQGLGATHSFENPAMMLVIDAGVLATVLFYWALLTFARQRRLAWRELEGHSFLLALLVSLGFSSYGTKSVAGYLLWLFAAVSSIAVHTDPVDDDDTSAAVPPTADDRAAS